MGDGADDVAAARAEVDLLRRRVLNVVGHELRTPVTTLRGLAELLGTTDDPGRTAAVRDAIQRSARRIENLLDDALVALGVSTALPVGPRHPTPVTDALGGAWSSVGDGPLDIDGTATAFVHPDGFQRALACVLDNAQKYGGAIRVEITDAEGDDVLVSILDDGPGLQAGEHPLLFEPFFRGERAVMTAPGLGLGLAVARQLVEHDGGSIDVVPAEPGGVLVTIRVRRG